MGRIPQNQPPKTWKTNIWSFEKTIKVLKSLSRARKRENSNEKEGPQQPHRNTEDENIGSTNRGQYE